LLPILAASGSAQADSVAERMTKLARAGETQCAEPWTYSRGLGKCICLKAGYSKQWGQCLPITNDLAGAKPETEPATTGALPEESKATAANPAVRMEQVAQAQDCLASLGLYEGAVDGEEDGRLQKAYGRFAEARGLPVSDDIQSATARIALQGACGERWVSAKAE
jgi:hypothetical protein